MAAHLQSRTLWAERQVEEFLSLPLVSEFVFRSPQTVDGSQREVADFLVTCDAKIGHFALTSINRLWTAENELRHERQRKEFLDLSLRPKCARLQMCRHPSAPEPALLFCHHCANSACMAK